MRRFGWVWAAAATFAVLGLAQAANAADPPPKPPPRKAAVSVVTQPDWEVRPTPEMMERHFPPVAVMFAISGYARITCHVKTDHTLSDCKVTEEGPAGLGFGAAALETAKDFRMKPETRDGEPVEGASVTIPVVFPIVDDDEDAKPPAKPAPVASKPVDPAARALAQRLVAVTMDRQTALRSVQESFQVPLQSAAQKSAIDPNALAELSQELIEASLVTVDNILAERTDAIARNMTLDQLKAAVAFFDSELGRAFMSAGAELATTESGAQIMEQIRDQVAKAYCASRKCPQPPKKTN